MSKGGSAPQAPDYSGLINAATQQQQQYAGIMNNELQFAQNTYNQNLPTYQAVAKEGLTSQQQQDQFAQEQRANYQQLYEPLQQQFVGAVKNYTSPTETARARGEAMSSVAQQYGAAGDAAKRQLQSYGVDPSSARFGALDIGTRTGEAAASAAAGTQSDINRETTGLGLQSTALNIGSQLPGQATASNAGGTAAGAGAVNATTGSYAPYAGAIANPVAFGGLSQNALGLAGSLTGQQYQGQLGQYSANQNSSSGFGSLLGAGLGVAQTAAMFMAKGGRVPSPSAVPTGNPSPVARSSFPTASRPMSLPRNLHRLSAVPLTMKFDGGGAVPLAGQQVPPSMSPSGGAQTDDVQAAVGQQGGPPQGGARINVDEFIMPKDVSNWIGGKQLQNMVMKARKEMATQAPAQPTTGPQQGAVPIGKAYARGGSVSGMGGAVGGGVPAPRVMTSTPHVGMPRPSIPRATLAARGHMGAVRLSPGAGGGAGPGVGMNLGGHRPPRPSMPVEGSPAGAVRSAVPGV